MAGGGYLWCRYPQPRRSFPLLCWRLPLGPKRRLFLHSTRRLNRVDTVMPRKRLHSTQAEGGKGHRKAFLDQERQPAAGRDGAGDIRSCSGMMADADYWTTWCLNALVICVLAAKLGRLVDAKQNGRDTVTLKHRPEQRTARKEATVKVVISIGSSTTLTLADKNPHMTLQCQRQRALFRGVGDAKTLMLSSGGVANCAIWISLWTSARGHTLHDGFGAHSGVHRVWIEQKMCLVKGPGRASFTMLHCVGWLACNMICSTVAPSLGT